MKRISFCRSCGANIKDTSSNSSSSKNNTVINEGDDRLLFIPLVLGIIGVIIGIVEGFNCPILFGWANIISEMVIVVFGGVVGLLFYYFKKEYLIAGMEFIITGVMMAFLIGNMAYIGCIIFVIAGILSIALTKKFKADYNLFYIAPILTVALPFIMIFLISSIMVMNQHELSNQVTIDNVNNSIKYDYGYYDGHVTGDIHFNKSVDHVSMELEYLDEKGKVLDKTYPLTEDKITEGKTYKFESTYMKKENPYKARITLKNNILNDDLFYIQNITLAQENKTN